MSPRVPETIEASESPEPSFTPGDGWVPEGDDSRAASYLSGPRNEAFRALAFFLQPVDFFFFFSFLRSSIGGVG